MEPTIYKPRAYKSPGIYKGAGGIYKGLGVYNDGAAEFVVIGGKKYGAILMPDGKKWITQNLDYIVSGVVVGGGGLPITPNAWYYNNDETNHGYNGIYKGGLLYNWYAAKLVNDDLLNGGSGWRVPNISDFINLFSSINNSIDKIKSKDDSIFSGFPSNWGGNDEFNLFIYPSGRYLGNFNYINNLVRFWSMTETSSNYANNVKIDHTNSYINENSDKTSGWSLRLCKDP